MELENNIGANIAYYLAKNNMSQRALAKEIGCSEQNISRYLHGARIPSAIMLGKIAVVLKVNPNRLIFADKNLNTECDLLLMQQAVKNIHAHIAVLEEYIAHNIPPCKGKASVTMLLYGARMKCEKAVRDFANKQKNK